MLSIVITAYKEPGTIGKVIECFTKQKIKDYELLALCPDKETAEVIKKYSKNNKKVKYIKDLGKGKPSALNIAFKKAKGDILVLSDGDVFVSDNSVNALLRHFKDKKVGAVTGKPVSISERDNMLGYWSHLLTDAAHKTRVNREGKYIDCSGYLYAIRNIIKGIPKDSLSDDAVISHIIWKKGYRIRYEPKAEVYVKYPSSFKDWIKQKKRSTGGYNQITKWCGKTERMRSFSREIIFGWYKALSYPKSFKEFFWTLVLFAARLYLWILIYIDINIKKESFEKTWKRVESTK